MGIGCSHHRVPSLSNTATRSAGGTKFGDPSVVTRRTNSWMACLLAPVRQLGSPLPVGPAWEAATTPSPAWSVVVAAGAFLTGQSVTAVRTRDGLRGAIGWLQGSAEHAGLRTGPVGTWVDGHKRALRIAAVAVASLALVFWGRPTGKVVLGLTLALLFALAIIEFSGDQGRPASKKGPSHERQTRRDPPRGGGTMTQAQLEEMGPVDYVVLEWPEQQPTPGEARRRPHRRHRRHRHRGQQPRLAPAGRALAATGVLPVQPAGARLRRAAACLRSRAPAATPGGRGRPDPAAQGPCRPPRPGRPHRRGVRGAEGQDPRGGLKITHQG
jgi:hypothetical protein